MEAWLQIGLMVTLSINIYNFEKCYLQTLYGGTSFDANVRTTNCIQDTDHNTDEIVNTVKLKGAKKKNCI